MNLRGKLIEGEKTKMISFPKWVALNGGVEKARRKLGISEPTMYAWLCGRRFPCTRLVVALGKITNPAIDIIGMAKNTVRYLNKNKK